MMGIRVLVISNYNIKTIARPEAEIFVGLAAIGFEITLMTFGDSPYVTRLQEAGVNVIGFHPLKRFSFKSIRIIRKELKRGKYHIAHFFNNKAMINGLFAAMGLPVKVALYRGYTGNIHWYDPVMYVKYLSPRADRIVCLVEAIRQIFLKNLLFNKEKAITINKGHDPKWYEGTLPAELSEFGVPPGAFTLVCAANQRAMKGLVYLLRAMSLLPAEANIHLILLGMNTGLDAYKNDIKFPDKIHNPGFRSDVLNIVKACDVFVLASIKGEAITKAVIEAMSLGVTPLITDIPGNVGLVINEQCGLVVPSKNPAALAAGILNLYNDREKCRQFGIRAREHVIINLNIKDTVQKFKNMYEEMAAPLLK